MPVEQISRLIADFEKLPINAIIDAVYMAALTKGAENTGLPVTEQEVHIAVVIDNSCEELTPKEHVPGNDLERVLTACPSAAKGKYIRSGTVDQAALMRGFGAIRNQIEKEYDCELHLFSEQHDDVGPCIKAELTSKVYRRALSLMIAV